MLALTVSFVLAAYILGPDAFSRFILDFVVPRRAVSLTKSEEIYRAVAWVSASLGGAYLWERWWGTLDRIWHWDQLEVFFAGIYSEQYFRENRTAWFASLHVVWWMNVCLLWRVYVLVLLFSLVLWVSIRNYAKLRYVLSRDGWFFRAARETLNLIVLPRVAHWHLILSRIYLHEADEHIELDVLTKMDILYRGRYEDKHLAPDGSLLSLTLTQPERFQRERYVGDKQSGKELAKAEYWVPIPTNIFVLLGSELHSVNIRYVGEVSALKKRMASKKLRIQLDELKKTVEELQAISSQPHIHLSSSPNGEEDRDSLD